MSLCLDFRRMAGVISSPGYTAAATAKPALEFLYGWLCSRDKQPAAPAGAAGPSSAAGSSDMPPVEEVWKQFELLASRLQEAYRSQPSYGHRWKGASGTVIMADVFTRLESVESARHCHEM